MNIATETNIETDISDITIDGDNYVYEKTYKSNTIAHYHYKGIEHSHTFKIALRNGPMQKRSLLDILRGEPKRRTCRVYIATTATATGMDVYV